MNNFAIKFHPDQLHLLDAKQVEGLVCYQNI